MFWFYLPMLKIGILSGYSPKKSNFQIAIVQTVRNTTTGKSSGTSLVLFPVSFLENDQQSAKQYLTPDFCKSCCLKSKPLALTTNQVQRSKYILRMREIGKFLRFSRDKYVPLQPIQRYSTRDIPSKVFLPLFFRGFVPFLSLADFVSRDKNL